VPLFSIVIKSQRRAAKRKAPITSPKWYGYTSLLSKIINTITSRAQQQLPFQSNSFPVSCSISGKYFKRMRPKRQIRIEKGTVTRKIDFHEKYVSSRPLTRGPDIKPEAVAIPTRPRLRPRLSAGNTALIIAGPEDIIIDAPIPCTKRLSSNRSKLEENAQPSEPKQKIKTPSR